MCASSRTSGAIDVRLQVRPLALAPRLLVPADVVPGPAVEAAVADRGHVLERHVVAEAVALVDRAPDVAGRGMDGEPGAVAQPGGVVPQPLSLGIEGADGRAVRLRAPGRAAAVRLLVGRDLRRRQSGMRRHCRPPTLDPDPTATKRRAPSFDDRRRRGPVTVGRDAGDDDLRGAGRLRVAGLVREAHDLVVLARRRRIAGRGPAGGRRCRTASGGPRRRPAASAATRPRLRAEDQDPAAVALRHEGVAVGGHADGARLVQAGGEQRDLEPGGRLGHRRPAAGARPRRGSGSSPPRAAAFWSRARPCPRRRDGAGRRGRRSASRRGRLFR